MKEGKASRSLPTLAPAFLSSAFFSSLPLACVSTAAAVAAGFALKLRRFSSLVSWPKEGERRIKRKRERKRDFFKILRQLSYFIRSVVVLLPINSTPKTNSDHFFSSRAI